MSNTLNDFFGRDDQDINVCGFCGSTENVKMSGAGDGIAGHATCAKCSAKIRSEIDTKNATDRADSDYRLAFHEMLSDYEG